MGRTDAHPQVGARAATLAALIAVALALAPAASAKTRFGFNDDGQNIAPAGNLIERSNADVMRVPIYWPLLEPAPEQWNFEHVDAVYERLLRAGVRPLFAIYSTPRHAVDRLPTKPGVDRGPTDTHAWKRLWRTVAERYPRALLQVWNEPNIAHYGPVPVKRMAKLTNQAAAAVRSVSPGRRVIGPPTAPNDSWRPYMKRLYKRTRPSVRVAVHIYPRVPPRWRRDFRRDLRFALRVAGKRKLWITETGLSRSQYGRKLQRRGTAWIVRRAWRAGVAAVIIHRLVRRKGAGAWDRGLAVTDRQLHPLPVFHTLKRLAARSRAK